MVSAGGGGGVNILFWYVGGCFQLDDWLHVLGAAAWQGPISKKRAVVCTPRTTRVRNTPCDCKKGIAEGRPLPTHII